MIHTGQMSRNGQSLGYWLTVSVLLRGKGTHMTAKEVKAAEDMVAGWRAAAGPGNPAGDLYAAGAFAEADIIAKQASYTHAGHCSICSASSRLECC
jgi:hypothetical protein